MAGNVQVRRGRSRILSLKIGLAMVMALMGLASCGASGLPLPYGSAQAIYQAASPPSQGEEAVFFAQDLCVAPGDMAEDGSLDMEGVTAAALFAPEAGEVVYAKNPHQQMYPASLTKVLTALVALRYGSLDMRLVATDNVRVQERGAQVLGLKPGDSMTLDQALRIFLLNSANDVANLIAENVGGSLEGFAVLMNQEARQLGATNSHFVNAHGLSDPNHYTTVYDLYLIFQAAVQYEIFKEIINMASYSTSYQLADGSQKAVEAKSTNFYLRGDVAAPEQVTVIGGKTGTTQAAGSCLILLSRDTAGSPYISVILQAQSRDLLYAKMSELLARSVN